MAAAVVAMEEASTTTTTRLRFHQVDQKHQTNSAADERRPEEWPQAKTPDLMLWRDMPRHLQFNPFIHGGYRPMLSLSGCLHSLFYVHNETINILTHAIPVLYILMTAPKLQVGDQPELRFLRWCHIIGSISPWVGSFTYHVFMNLERGQQVYRRLLQLDMLGIWICQCFGALPMVSATTYCLPLIVRSLITSSYCIVCLWGLYKAMTAVSPWDRRLCFLMPFSMRVFVCILRLYNLGGDPAALTHLILQDLIAIIGGAVGAMYIPEKWFPGCVDMYLNSHNIMHVLVVAAVYCMHIATMRDLHWMERANCTTLL